MTATGTVTKTITRQALTQIAIGGTYLGAQAGSYSGCSASANNGPYTDKYGLTVSQSTSNAATLTFVYDSGATCTISGTLQQYGQLYQMPSDRESQAQATMLPSRGRILLTEGLEDMGQELGGDSDARIDYTDLYLVLCHLTGNANSASGRRELDCVEEQVPQDLLQSLAFSCNGKHRRQFVS